MGLEATEEELQEMSDIRFIWKLNGFRKDREGNNFASVINITDKRTLEELLKEYGTLTLCTNVLIKDLPLLGISINRIFKPEKLSRLKGGIYLCHQKREILKRSV